MNLLKYKFVNSTWIQFDYSKMKRMFEFIEPREFQIIIGKNINLIMKKKAFSFAYLLR